MKCEWVGKGWEQGLWATSFFGKLGKSLIWCYWADTAVPLAEGSCGRRAERLLWLDLASALTDLLEAQAGDVSAIVAKLFRLELFTIHLPLPHEVGPWVTKARVVGGGFLGQPTPVLPQGSEHKLLTPIDPGKLPAFINNSSLVLSFLSDCWLQCLVYIFLEKKKKWEWEEEGERVNFQELFQSCGSYCLEQSCLPPFSCLDWQGAWAPAPPSFPSSQSLFPAVYLLPPKKNTQMKTAELSLISSWGSSFFSVSLPERTTISSSSSKYTLGDMKGWGAREKVEVRLSPYGRVKVLG